jgi:hypothetical protein
VGTVFVTFADAALDVIAAERLLGVQQIVSSL